MIQVIGLPAEPIPTPALPLKGRVNSCFSPLKEETEEGDGVAACYVSRLYYFGTTNKIYKDG